MKLLRILTGQTGSGKSAVAVELARAVDAEIILVDSMKVYRRLDIGTAKPSPAERDAVSFHLLDIVDAQESFSLARYLEAVRAVVTEITARGRRVLFVGGTPLYLRGLIYGVFDGPAADWPLREALLERARRDGPGSLHEALRKLDPVTAQRLHPNDLRRIIRALEVASLSGRPISDHQRQFPAAAPAVPYRMVALRRSEADLRDRINRRTDRMFGAGLVDEVRLVLKQGRLSRSAQKAIGYREVIAHLKGELSLAETVAQVKRNTWRLARKQKTWLKSFPGIRWLDVPAGETPDETTVRVQELPFDCAHGPEPVEGLFGPEMMN